MVGAESQKEAFLGQIVRNSSKNLTEALDLGANPCNNYSVHLDEFGGVLVWQR